MDKPRIFLGSSGKQEKLLQALTRGLEDVAHVEPWTTSFNPGTRRWNASSSLPMKSTSRRSCSLTTTGRRNSPPASPRPGSGQASPRDNVVFEAGLFGGVLGMRRTFILHANGAKLPSDLLGLTCVRYGEATTPAEMRVVNQKLRKAIESEGRVARIEGLWWQFSLTERTAEEPSAVSLLKISRDRDGALELAGRSWQEDGRLSARYWSEAAKERKEPPGVFYYWKGERPLDPNAPQLEGTGEIRMESAERASGYFTTRSDAHPGVNARTAGVSGAPIRGPEHPGRPRRPEARRADRAAADGLEVEQERRDAAMALATFVLLTAVVAPSPGIEARFIGNSAFEVSDGTATILIDFPYQSGAFGYMTFLPAELRPRRERAVPHHTPPPRPLRSRGGGGCRLFCRRSARGSVGCPSVVAGGARADLALWWRSYRVRFDGSRGRRALFLPSRLARCRAVHLGRCRRPRRHRGRSRPPRRPLPAVMARLQRRDCGRLRSARTGRQSQRRVAQPPGPEAERVVCDPPGAHLLAGGWRGSSMVLEGVHSFPRLASPSGRAASSRSKNDSIRS